MGAFPRARTRVRVAPRPPGPCEAPDEPQAAGAGAASATLKARTRDLLQQYGVRPSRRRGQNFLVDPRVRDRIVNAAGLGPDSAVLEIGPGTGILTEALLLRGARVLAIEVDRRLAGALAARFAGRSGLTLAVGDALDFDFSAALRDHPGRGRVRVVANIPYNITTPLILRLIRCRELFDILLLTVQREVAERLTAPPGEKAYGSLTLACQYRAAVRTVFSIPRTAFYPAPEVDSVLVRFDLLDAPRVSVRDPEQLFEVIRAAFGTRRKTLRNALVRTGRPACVVESALAAAEIEGRRRGETLTLAEFARLSDSLPARENNARGRGAETPAR
jgi:16S rRNA (adenine1518-N6/adenine1519-N6)-dimethyltransferase